MYVFLFRITSTKVNTTRRCSDMGEGGLNSTTVMSMRASTSMVNDTEEVYTGEFSAGE